MRTPKNPWIFGSGEWKGRVLEDDLSLKRRTIYWYNEYEQKQRLTEHYDISQIIERNKALYAMTDERASWKGDWHLIGSVPVSIMHDVMQKTNHGKDTKAVAKWVNDPDNRFFLTRPVKL